MKNRRYINNDPKIIKAKFQSICAETGEIIKAGEDCLYYPGSKSVFKLDTKQAEEFRNWKFDINWLGANY